jgi:hypothetical protein
MQQVVRGHFRTMDSATIHGFCHHSWILPPFMDSATIHGFCHHSWILPPFMDSATIHGFCHHSWIPLLPLVSVDDIGAVVVLCLGKADFRRAPCILCHAHS